MANKRGRTKKKATKLVPCTRTAITGYYEYRTRKSQWRAIFVKSYYLYCKDTTAKGLNTLSVKVKDWRRAKAMAGGKENE